MGLSHAELVSVGTNPMPKCGHDVTKWGARLPHRNGFECDGAKAGRYRNGVEDCTKNSKVDGLQIVCKSCGKVGFDAEQTCPGGQNVA